MNKIVPFVPIPSHFILCGQSVVVYIIHRFAGLENKKETKKEEGKTSYSNEHN
jgi:hypothetical protein